MTKKSRAYFINVFKKFSSVFTALAMIASTFAPLAALPATAFADTVSAGDVVINEFASDVNAGDTEWVELYNTTSNDIDLTGWQLQDSNDTHHTELTGTIAAHDFAVFDGPQLNNPGDTILLMAPRSDNSGLFDMIDHVPYGDASAAVVGAPGKGQSAYRTTDGGDTWDITDSPTKDASNVVAPTDTTAPTEPVASPIHGFYYGAQTVTFSSTDNSGVPPTIYYTTDGSTPSNTHGTEYTGPISVSSSVSFEAIAYDAAGNASSVGVYSYAILPAISLGSAALAVQPQTVAQGDAITLDATLTENVPVFGVVHPSGEKVEFSVNGTDVGSAETDSNGEATLTYTPSPAIAVGTYQNGITASVDTGPIAGVITGNGDLTVTGTGPTASVTTGDFGTWDNSPSFKGINVGFTTADFTNVSGITVDIYDGATKIAENTASAALINDINTQADSFTQNGSLSSPFVISGTLNDTYCAGGPCWTPGTYTWNSSTLPTKAIITVTGTDANGNTSQTAENDTFTQGMGTFASFFPSVVLNAENFNTVDDATYKGVSVGFDAKDFGTVSGVTVDMTRADGSHAIKHGTQDLFDLISANTAPYQFTAPFVIQAGTYDPATDSYWTSDATTWSSFTTPQSVKITVSGTNGTESVTNSNFSQGAPSWPTYASLLSPAACNGSSFDGDTLGSVNGQNGWTSTGSYDQAIVDNIYGFTTFGCKTLRISNAVTSGAFGDQTFSFATANEAGESAAVSRGTHAAGTRQNHFDAQFDIAAAMLDEQPGLALSVSPDDGTGDRMSYLRFEDQADGIHVFFDDVPGGQASIGTANEFTESDIATLDRSKSHTIKFSMDFVDGASNDIVKIYIDGTLVKTGTSWEDYYRYDPEQAGNGNKVPTVDTLLFRAAGTAAPATSGAGFLIDNVSLSSSEAAPGASDSNFTAEPLYVREHNSGDTAAQALVPAAATAARFTYTQTDGSNVYSDIAGTEHLQAGQFPIPSTGQHQYRGHVDAVAGVYDVTGEFEMGGNWYPITGSSTLYVLGNPTGSFVFPSPTYNIFRPTDNPARISAGDANDTFSRVSFNVDGTNYIVNRAQCDLREAGNRVLCDVDQSSTWTGNLAEGTHTVSATVYNFANNHSAIASTNFTVDGTRPDVSNLAISPKQPAYDGSITASADASDTGGIKNMEFYVTSPRADGACTGNGTQLATSTDATGSSGTYSGTLDLSTIPSGTYCVSAIAEDLAANHSSIISQSFTIQHAAPVYVMTEAATGITAADATLNGTNGDSDATGHSFWVSTSTFATSSSNIPANVYSTPDFGSIAAHTDFTSALSSLTTDAVITGGVHSAMPAITPNTTYYYVAWSRVGGTWYPGAEQSFTTTAAPSVTTDAATNVTQADATLNGTNGAVDAQGYLFWVSKSAIDTSNPNVLPTGAVRTAVLGSAAAGQSFSASLSSLTTAGVPSDMAAITPGTTYHYVAWVEVNGTWYPGADETVTTAAAPVKTAVTLQIHQTDIATSTSDIAANPTKWYFADDQNDVVDDSLGAFVNGPGTAPIGNGSAQLSIASANEGRVLATQSFKGIPLSEISKLSYSTYRSAGDAALAPALQFDINSTATTTPTHYEGRLIFEPYQTGATVETGQWQTWDAMTGAGWWFSHASATAADGKVVTTTCTQANPCTWSQVLAQFPDIGITGMTGFKVGSGWTSGFTGNIDDFVIEINDSANDITSTYDFEPRTGTITTITNAADLIANGSTVGVPFHVAWSVAPVTGIGAPTGTVDVTVNGGAGCSATVADGGCDITPTSVGSVTLQATYNDDASFDQSSSATVSHQVNATSNPSNNGTVSGGGGGGPVAVIGDLNGDGRVNFLDFALLMTAMTSKGTSLAADLNGDGSVDLADLAILMAHWTF